MTGDAWVTLAVVALTLAVLAWDRYPPAAVVLAATVLLLVAGVIDYQQAFAGFSNPAPITVAAMFVVARGVQRTGVLAVATSRMLGDPDSRGALVRLLLPTAGASAFLNNTPIVAMLIPSVLTWAKRREVPASRFLMPLSYATILGGTITVLGTSTNLVVSGLLVESGQEPLGLFEITHLGLPVAVVGLAVLILVVPHVLPVRRTVLEQAAEVFREFSVGMQVVDGGPMDGRTVAEAGLRDLSGVFLVALEREGRVTAPVTSDTALSGGDQLTFVGKSDDVIDLQRSRGLRSVHHEHLLAVDSHRHTFYEAVIGRSSPLVGKTLREANFRSTYQAAVVAIHRSGQRLPGKLGTVELRSGDTLVILAAPGFARRWRDGRDFLMVARVGGPPPSAGRKAPLATALLLAMIVVAALGILPILEAALIAAGTMVATRVLTVGEARESIDVDVLVLIAAAFGLGAAIETTGLAAVVATAMVNTMQPFGVVGVVLGIVLVTMALTEVVTNNAAAVIVFPIAVGIAEAGDLDARALALAVAVAASTSFLTPVGYQTNTMVFGPGGYRFGDFARAGLPLNLAVIVVITAVTTLTAV